jgi:hypothetical protein
LDDADERELDLDDHRIEFGATGGKLHARLLPNSGNAVREKIAYLEGFEPPTFWSEVFLLP